MNKVEIIQLTLGELDTNCYLAYCSETHATLIIDPADSGEFISQTLLEKQLDPVAIVLTHGHFDHVLGLLELKLNFPVPIMLHSADDFLLAEAQASAQHWLKHETDPVPSATTTLEDGQIIAFGRCNVEVLHTPGHTPGSVCLYNDEVIFTGDTLFKAGVGRTDFRYSSSAQLEDSLTRLKELPGDLQMYPGHGESSTLGVELQPAS